MIVLDAIAYLYALWLIYVMVMGFYRAHLAGTLEGVTKWLAMPAVGIGWCMDVLCNWTIAIVVFADLPDEKLLTDRLIRYRANPGTWRAHWAEMICRHLLDPFDPSGKHCQ